MNVNKNEQVYISLVFKNTRQTPYCFSILLFGRTLEIFIKIQGNLLNFPLGTSLGLRATVLETLPKVDNNSMAVPYYSNDATKMK